MGDRIRTIKALLANDPDDVFLHYSLAMEYASAGSFDEAVAEFRRCMELDAAYLPAYVEAGKCLRSAGRPAEARRAFQEGAAIAAARGDGHVQDFLRQQLAGLGEPGRGPGKTSDNPEVAPPDGPGPAG